MGLGQNGTEQGVSTYRGRGWGRWAVCYTILLQLKLRLDIL